MESGGFKRPGLLRKLFEFVFPHYCKVCGHRLDPSEEQLCVTCFLGMPRLGYRADVINPTERMLLTEKSLVRAASVVRAVSRRESGQPRRAHKATAATCSAAKP